MNDILEENWNGSVLKTPSGWKGLERVIRPIIKKYNLKTESALEFGVDTGYSLHILSQIFKDVTGVDKFESDVHINHEQGETFFNEIKQKFNNTNTKLVKADFREYIKSDSNYYDLIHVDIVHLYKETFECAEWSIKHADVVLIHDTTSFPDMNRVCRDIATKYNLEYNNSIQRYNGLGILAKKRVF